MGAYTRVGTGSKLLGAITIGERAVIGAGAVVIADVPEAATVVGVPAKVVRQGPVGDELPAALERMKAMMDAAAAVLPGGERAQHRDTEAVIDIRSSTQRFD